MPERTVWSLRLFSDPAMKLYGIFTFLLLFFTKPAGILDSDQRAEREVKRAMYYDVDELIFGENEQVVSSQR